MYDTVPDFRGPKGIWTQEMKKKIKSGKSKAEEKSNNHNETSKANVNVNGENSKKRRKLNPNPGPNQNQTPPPPPPSFETARPTLTHRAITHLSKMHPPLIQYCITQNVDGLHARSGMPRSRHCFLHGCIFTEKCEVCGKEFFRDFDVGGVSFQPTGRFCDADADVDTGDDAGTGGGRRCGGALRDTILDWEDELPQSDWITAQEQCSKSDLVLALGTSLRIEPAGSLPTLGEKFVIVNKQVTPYDDRAEMVLRADVEEVMRRVMQNLDLVEDDWDDVSVDV